MVLKRMAGYGNPRSMMVRNGRFAEPFIKMAGHIFPLSENHTFRTRHGIFPSVMWKCPHTFAYVIEQKACCRFTIIPEVKRQQTNS